MNSTYRRDQARNTKLFLLACLAVIIVFACVAIWHAFSFHVISTEPTTGKVSTISPFFKIDFSQELSTKNLQVTASPSGFAGKATVTGKVLTIPFTTLLTSGKTYTITITAIESVSGKALTNQTFSFKPTYIPSSELPKDQQETLIRQQDTHVQSPSNPITKYLPHQTTDFTLSALATTSPSKQFPLLALITPSQADMGNESAAVSQYEQEVVNYIASLGLNANDYNITYRVQNP